MFIAPKVRAYNEFCRKQGRLQNYPRNTTLLNLMFRLQYVPSLWTLWAFIRVYLTVNRGSGTPIPALNWLNAMLCQHQLYYTLTYALCTYLHTFLCTMMYLPTVLVNRLLDKIPPKTDPVYVIMSQSVIDFAFRLPKISDRQLQQHVKKCALHFFVSTNRLKAVSYTVAYFLSAPYCYFASHKISKYKVFKG